MHLLIEKITRICVQKDIIEKNDAEWFKYGIERRITTTITAIFFFIIGCFISNANTTTAFLFCFYFLRLRTNGFHAKTFMGCIVISILLEALLLCVLLRVMNCGLFFSLIGISFIIIFALAPFNDGDLHLDKCEHAACRRGARIRITITSFFAIAAYYISVDIGNGIMLGNTMTALLLVIANIKKEIAK